MLISTYDESISIINSVILKYNYIIYIIIIPIDDRLIVQLMQISRKFE